MAVGPKRQGLRRLSVGPSPESPQHGAPSPVPLPHPHRWPSFLAARPQETEIRVRSIAEHFFTLGLALRQLWFLCCHRSWCPCATAAPPTTRC